MGYSSVCIGRFPRKGAAGVSRISFILTEPGGHFHRKSRFFGQCPAKVGQTRRSICGISAKFFSFSLLPFIIRSVLCDPNLNPAGCRCSNRRNFILKKIITKAVCLLCAGALVLGAAGCSKSADSSSAASSTAAAVYGSAEDYDYENFSYSSGLDENGYWEGVKALDYVTLPENFASLTFKRSEIEPTEEELQSEIDSLLSDHATEKQVTDRAAADGDTVNIDYAGSVDGVAFSGGTYSGYSLTLGSGTFVDGFEDQIVGHTPGETFDVTVTFPEGYSDSTDSEGNTVVLSGKKAVFSVTLNYISEKVLPELTDAWVAENYGESDDVHTVEELKALYQKMLYNTNLQNAIMDDLLANSTFKELPKEVTDYQVNQCLNYYYTMANYYGYDLDSFVQTAAGYENADDLLEGMSDSITTYSKEALLYQAVAETLDIVPTQEQIDTYSSYTGTYGENYCTMVALMDAVTDALTESAVVS